MVAQHYDTDVNKEYVITGNSIVLKCQVPSFVADFVEVLSWHTDDNEDFLPGENYGYSFTISFPYTNFLIPLTQKKIPKLHTTNTFPQWYSSNMNQK